MQQPHNGGQQDPNTLHLHRSNGRASAHASHARCPPWHRGTLNPSVVIKRRLPEIDVAFHSPQRPKRWAVSGLSSTPVDDANRPRVGAAGLGHANDDCRKVMGTRQGYVRVARASRQAVARSKDRNGHARNYVIDAIPQVLINVRSDISRHPNDLCKGHCRGMPHQFACQGRIPLQRNGVQR
jgi:hypothetical protein